MYGHNIVSAGSTLFTHKTMAGWLQAGLNNGVPGTPSFTAGQDQYVGHLDGAGATWLDAGKVKVENADTQEYLYNKFNDTSTFDVNAHQLVYAQKIDNGGTAGPGDRIKLFTNNSNSIRTILITGTVAPATYSAGTLTPTSGTKLACLFTLQGNNTMTTGAGITLRNYYPDSVSISNGQAAIGKAILVSGNFYDLLTVNCSTFSTG
jgi:hypothetical protein